MKSKIKDEAMKKAIDMLVEGGADLTTLFEKDGLLK